MTAQPAADVVWHDAECGGYAADLPLWEELAEQAGGPILDLGCGTGRVGLWLAERGHEVLGVDSDAELVAEFNARAAELPARAEIGDVRALRIGRRFPLVLAPMQLVQLLANAGERGDCLTGIDAHLVPGGIAALAIVEDLQEDAVDLLEDDESAPLTAPPLPDTREVDGRVYSSLPLPTVLEPGAIVVRRLRQTVSPEGRLAEEESSIRLRPLSARELEREASAAGFEPLPIRFIPATEDHVGSTAVLLRKGGA